MKLLRLITFAQHHQDVHKLSPDLHQECKEQSDEITKYFVDKFTEIAVKAIPVINYIEG